MEASILNDINCTNEWKQVSPHDDLGLCVERYTTSSVDNHYCRSTFKSSFTASTEWLGSLDFVLVCGFNSLETRAGGTCVESCCGCTKSTTTMANCSSNFN